MKYLSTILVVIFAIVVLGLLGVGGWMLRDVNEQAKVLRSQTAEQQAELKKVQAGLEKLGGQIGQITEVVSAGEKQNTEIKTSLTSLGKQGQDQAAELTKGHEQISAATATVDQDVKQSQTTLGQINQALTDQKTLLADARMDMGERITEVETWVESLAKTQAYQHHLNGIKLWDANDLPGAITEFKQAVNLNNDAAGDYYNIALGYYRLGQTNQACEFAYQAAGAYFKNKDIPKVNRMFELLKAINPSSKFITKLRDELVKKPAQPPSAE